MSDVEGWKISKKEYDKMNIFKEMIKNMGKIDIIANNSQEQYIADQISALINHEKEIHDAMGTSIDDNLS